MSVYSFRLNLMAPGGFDAHFSKLGSAKHRDEILEEDAEAPSQNDITSVVDQIEKDKQCLIYWYPEKARSFEPLKGKPSNKQVVLYLFLEIKDSKESTDVSFRYRVTLQGLTVVEVTKDPRMGYQVAKIAFASLAKERK
jgi:hypothetical protein